MEKELVKIKYLGTRTIKFAAVERQAYTGIVKTGQVIEISKELYDKELKNDVRWELSSENVSHETNLKDGKFHSQIKIKGKEYIDGKEVKKKKGDK